MKKSRKEKQLRSIRKSRLGFSIFLFAIILIGITVILYFGGLSVPFLMVKSRMTLQYEDVTNLANIYESLKKNGNDQNDVLAFAKQDFFVMDQNGEIILTKGENTCAMQEGLYVIEDLNELGELYLDQYFTSFANESHKLDEYDRFQMFSIMAMITLQQMSGMEDDLRPFAVWYVIHVMDGKESFVAKAVIELPQYDLALTIGIAAIVVGILIIILVLMVINIVSNAVRQRKIFEMFLTDPVTKGHNLTWLNIKEEPVIRSRGAAGRKYAIAEVVFVNYRNFCTCHSLEEGEEILYKIYNVIKEALTRREACAHVTTSSFCVVMTYEDDNRLRGRLRGMIEALENIDRTHKFAFHVGVKILDVRRNAKGKLVRRKDLNLEAEYNDACMARATLSDSDDSRIAFFDQKLLDEGVWIDNVHENQEKGITNEEYVVYYQPKYDPKTGKLRGAEALIRWDSPELGFVSPSRFIPIFEKNGFITEIDHYMIKHVARDQKAWLDKGLNCVPVSVNVSRAHFIESDLAEQIRGMVDEAGAPRNLIEIELTESAFFDDKNAMIQTIQKLKGYGFRVSMDDFGAGYSSLNSLKDMPLDVLKLDADFFRGENEGGRGEIVVAEAIQLAKKLEMHTVAEGVEESSQVSFLAKQGCDMIQGYYFAKPMPKGSYEECLRTGVSDKKVEGSAKAEVVEVKTEVSTEAEPEAAEVKAEAEMEAATEGQKAQEIAEAADVSETAEEEAVEGTDKAEAVAEAEMTEAADASETAEAKGTTEEEK